MKRLSILLAALLILGCEEHEPDDNRYSRITGEKLFYDPQWKIYVPKNFQESSYVLAAAKGKVESRFRAGGGIASTFYRSVALPNKTASVQRLVACPVGAVVTGLGLLFSTNGTGVQDMIVEYQYINSSGYFEGPRERLYASGSRLTPDYQLEAWISVPPGNIVTGIGLIGKYDVQRLDVWSKTYNQELRRYETLTYRQDTDGLATGKTVQISYRATDEYQHRYNAALITIGLGVGPHGVEVMSFEVGTFIP